MNVIECIYLMNRGYKQGYVTPSAKPISNLDANNSHMLALARIGVIKVMTPQNAIAGPRTILVPILSAKDPPATWRTTYP